MTADLAPRRPVPTIRQAAATRSGRYALVPGSIALTASSRPLRRRRSPSTPREVWDRQSNETTDRDNGLGDWLRCYTLWGDAEPAASSDREGSSQLAVDERCSAAPSSGLQITGFSADVIAVFSSSVSDPQISDLAESVGRGGAAAGVLQTSVDYQGRLLYLDWADAAARPAIDRIETLLLESDLVVDIIACMARDREVVG
jgi:hypothetical protein